MIVMDLDRALVQRIVEPTEDVWVARGLYKPFRVVSIDHTYGEWETLTEARAFLALLVAGNANLRELS